MSCKSGQKEFGIIIRDNLRPLQKAAFANGECETAQSFSYAQRRKRGRRKRFARKARCTLRRFRRLALLLL